MDALDPEAVHRVVADAAPEAVVHELTGLPHDLDPRRMEKELAPTNRLRTEGTRHLVDGPDTAYAPDGGMIAAIRSRDLPVVGGGQGVFSFIHVDDVAEATVRALAASAPGTYNIVDDAPARASDWIPYTAELVGAPPPRRVPTWLASVMAGRYVAYLMTRQRGASNVTAREGLGWRPTRYSSWRDGFADTLAIQGSTE
jgi:nucleoside-diphosphate-sugar epimerase